MSNEKLRQKVKATCSICGKENTLKLCNLYDVKASHNGNYVCRDCGRKLYFNSEDYKFDKNYKYSNRENYAKSKLKKDKVVLLNDPKNEENVFPIFGSRIKCLKLKCIKCGCVWMDSPRRQLIEHRGCPVCRTVKADKKKLEKINEQT